MTIAKLVSKEVIEIVDDEGTHYKKVTNEILEELKNKGVKVKPFIPDIPEEDDVEYN